MYAFNVKRKVDIKSAYKETIKKSKYMISSIIYEVFFQ